MCPEDLNERDLQSRDLAVHEDSREIELDLETNVYVRTINRRAPPECESTIRNLRQTGALGVGELLELHPFLETGRFLPKETFPRREVRGLKQAVLQNTFHSSQSLDQVPA